MIAMKDSKLTSKIISGNKRRSEFMNAKDIPLPDNWPPLVRKALLHAVSLAYHMFIHTRSWAANSPIERVRLKSELDDALREVSLLKEQLRILRQRFEQIPPHMRPHYKPEARMDILLHMAARGWSVVKAARQFLVSPDTIREWRRRINDGERLASPPPVNKYPLFVGIVSRTLKTLAPRFGRKTIAEYFARAGLAVSASTVRRRLQEEPTQEEKPSSGDDTKKKSRNTGEAVTSKHPDHLWLLDLTVVPTSGGFVVPWLPFALPQVWPFCWWALVIVDHFSRKAVGFALFKRPPTSEEAAAAFEKATQRNGHPPKHIITDQGGQFTGGAFKRRCAKLGVEQRYGAVGQHGSIAVTERFIKSVKDEALRIIPIPLDMTNMRKELALYLHWYNNNRPHQSRGAMTPMEVYSQAQPLKLLEFEPNSAAPNHGLKASFLDGRRHLPIVEIIPEDDRLAS